MYQLLHSVQPFSNDYMGDFNAIHNESKHNMLVEQVRKEIHRVKVTSPSGILVSVMGIKAAISATNAKACLQCTLLISCSYLTHMLHLQMREPSLTLKEE